MLSRLNIKKFEIVGLLVPLVQVIVGARSGGLPLILREPLNYAELFRIFDGSGCRSGLVQESELGASI